MPDAPALNPTQAITLSAWIRTPQRTSWDVIISKGFYSDAYSMYLDNCNRLSVFVAGEPGWKLLAADYSQVELRVLAHPLAGRSSSEAHMTSLTQTKRISVMVGTRRLKVLVDLGQRWAKPMPTENNIVLLTQHSGAQNDGLL